MLGVDLLMCQIGSTLLPSQRATGQGFGMDEQSEEKKV